MFPPAASFSAGYAPGFGGHVLKVARTRLAAFFDDLSETLRVLEFQGR
jgi:hypothetical protein